MEWFDPCEKLPKENDLIIAKLRGCKIVDYISMKVRYCEGFGHIKEWRYATPDEIKSF